MSTRRSAASAERLAYPIEEGFHLVGLTRTGGYKAIADGHLKTFKVGKRRLVSREALEQFVAYAQEAKVA